MEPRKTRKQEVIRGEMTWSILEKILNNYNEWGEICRETGQYDLDLLNGMTVNFFDILDGIDKLPPRQKQALTLTCLENRKEVEVARMMGFSKWSSPVGMYKRQALRSLAEQFNLRERND